MFRDPSFHRALREQVLPLLRTYPFIRIWVAGCSTGEEVVLARDRAARGGPARAHADLRDRHRRRRCSTRARTGVVPAGAACRLHARTTSRAGGTRGVLRATTRRGDAARASTRRCCATSVFAQHNLATDRLVQRVPPDRLPQRADLLRPRAAGPRARAVRRQPRAPRRARRSGRKETLQRHRDRGALRAARRGREDLPAAADDACELVVIGASWGGLQRRGERPARACRPDFPAPCSSSSTAAERRRGAAGASCSAATARCRSARPRTRQPLPPGGVLVAPRRLPRCSSSRGHFALSTEAAVRFSRPSIDVALRDGGRRATAPAWSASCSPAPTTTAPPGLAAIRAPRRHGDRRRTPSTAERREMPGGRAGGRAGRRSSRARRHRRALLARSAPLRHERAMPRARASCSSTTAPRTSSRCEAVLEPLACRLVTATLRRGGAEGAAAATTSRSILLDVQMPGMDGFETAELIKRARAHARRSRSSS